MPFFGAFACALGESRCRFFVRFFAVCRLSPFFAGCLSECGKRTQPPVPIARERADPYITPLNSAKKFFIILLDKLGVGVV